MSVEQKEIPVMSEEEEQYIETEKRLYELYKHRSTNQVQAQALEREKRIATLTLVELEKLPEETKTYKSIGRMFIKKDQNILKQDMKKNMEYCDTELKKLQETRISIQKRIETEEESFRSVFNKLYKDKQQ
ncbi:hypothetical protein ABK040_012330 [Willaertia magna]